MSGVLDRMVKQARSTLPTVQPLTAPRFAPVGGAMLESFAETDIHTAEDSPRRRRQPNETQEDVAARSLQQSADAPPARELPKPRTLIESKEEFTGAQNRIAGRTLQSKETDLPETQMVTVRTPKIEALDNASVDSTPARKRSQLRDETDVEFSDRTNLEKSSKKQLTAPERAELAMEVRNTTRRDAGVQVGSQQPPEEQRTEIHISIGSIELRAPRVEPRPQAAPFRPRVSLDNFLRRKPEAEA